MGSLKYHWIVLIFCLPSKTPAFDIKKGFVIQFEKLWFRKLKLKTALDGIFMSVLNFDWLVLHKIKTIEVCIVKKEQNKKRNHCRLQTKQQQKFDDSETFDYNSIFVK